MTTIASYTPEEITKTITILARIKEAGRLGGNEECHALLWNNSESIRRYLYTFEMVGVPDSSFIKGYVDDALARFFNTIDILAGKTTGKVLEIGATHTCLRFCLEN